MLNDRCQDYSPHKLDELFMGGALTWFRPQKWPQGASHNPRHLVAVTPIAMVPRRNTFAWRDEARGEPQSDESGVAAEILQLLQQHGAMFADDLANATGVLVPQLEYALSTLIARGLVTADEFSPLRWLCRPEAQKHKQQKAMRRKRIPPAAGLLGRWSTVGGSARHASNQAADLGGQASLEVTCHALLKRYGVVFRAVLERENLLPPWRLLLRYLRRMEDRGEVHGGRFVDGFSGEQFALAEVTALLRRHQQAPEMPVLTVINATDPLNLGGIITAGGKTPAKPGNRILLSNGVPVAHLVSDTVEFLCSRPTDLIRREAENRLRIVRAINRDAVH